MRDLLSLSLSAATRLSDKNPRSLLLGIMDRASRKNQRQIRSVFGPRFAIGVIVDGR